MSLLDVTVDPWPACNGSRYAEPTVDNDGLLPLTVSGLCLQRGGRQLIDDIGFELAAHRVTAVLGPNGAGKTLLLRMLSGLLAPDSGQVSWHGRRIRTAMPRLGLVLQKPVMLRRSVRANVEFALARSGVARAQRRSRAEAALEWADLAAHKHVPAPRLSGGEAHRLAIARAWVQQPEVLFLDEPCASLDPRSTQTVETLINRMSAEGTRIIFTSHDMAQARRLADEVLFLADGQLCEHTAAHTFFVRPTSIQACAYLEGRLLT